MRAALAAIGLALALGGCLVPPSQSSFGAAATGLGAGYRASMGASSAAIDPDDEAIIDLGAGWVTEGGTGADSRPAVQGTYISLGRRFALGPHHALWLSGRAEMFWLVDRGQPRDGLVARLALRDHLTGVRAVAGGSGGAAAVIGAVAAGLYADLGARRFEGGGGELFVAAGVTLDLPLLFGLSKWAFY